ncbi:MAG: ABC transporter permease [Proteobacteria bacterium]|nr:ABC transporter permease [Pseudomonadota bacterium]
MSHLAKFADFSWVRLKAIIMKEFIQMRRDRLTFAMMIILPLIQLILFGFAINTNPKRLPTAVVNADYSPLTRAFVSAIQNSEYFQIKYPHVSEDQAEKLLARGSIQFIVQIPLNFSKDLIRGNKPNLLVIADATDPVATSNATGALSNLANTVFDRELSRGLSYLLPNPEPFNLIVHQRYNPEALSQYNIVPGLMGVVLTMTMVMITGLAITRERERGTMESLLATPVRPIEVMIGKIIPYIIVGYIQQLLIIAAGIIIFGVPHQGSILILLLATLPFIFANLAVGLTFSTVAKNQLQAVQMAFFFFLPSILLSGFMFPFHGMPRWAQIIGNCLPLTHFLNIVRGILLKGNGFRDFLSQLWPLLLFIVVVMTIAVRRYKETLD